VLITTQKYPGGGGSASVRNQASALPLSSSTSGEVAAKLEVLSSLGCTVAGQEAALHVYLRKKLFILRRIKHWNRQLRDVVESL